MMAKNQDDASERRVPEEEFWFRKAQELALFIPSGVIGHRQSVESLSIALQNEYFRGRLDAMRAILQAIREKALSNPELFLSSLTGNNYNIATCAPDPEQERMLSEVLSELPEGDRKLLEEWIDPRPILRI
jgi:hypothetical protein